MEAPIAQKIELIVVFVEAKTTPKKLRLVAQKKCSFCGSTSNKNRNKKWVKVHLEAVDGAPVALNFSKCFSDC